MAVREQGDSIWWIDELGQWVAAYRCIPQDGRLVVAEVRVFPREREDDIGDAAAKGLWSGRMDVVPPGGMAARVLRELKPGQAARKAGGPSDRSFAIDATFVTSDSAMTVQNTESRGATGAMPKLTVEQRLARVAAHYVLAVQEGSQHPNQDVALKLGVSYTKVTEDLRAARRKKILAPTTQGQSRGEMTDEGDDVLNRFVESRMEYLEQALRATWGGPEVRRDAGLEELRMRTLGALRWLDIDWVDVRNHEPEGGQPEGVRNSLIISWGQEDE